jgi:Family of unknown function (DUF6325)
LSVEDVTELGPIDYLLVEWPGRQPEGQIAPHLIDLVDRGLIRILDLAFLVKAQEGTVTMASIDEVGGEVAELSVFEGASSGLLGEDDAAGRIPTQAILAALDAVEATA